MILTVWHEYPTGEDDACIASTIIQLKAHELGLGSCWLQTKGNLMLMENLVMIISERF